MKGENPKNPKQHGRRDERQYKASHEHHERVPGIVGALHTFFFFGRSVSHRIESDHHETSCSSLVKLETCVQVPLPDQPSNLFDDTSS